MTHLLFPTRDKFLVFGAPLIEQAEIDEVTDWLKTGWLGRILLLIVTSQI
jgi:hypothetical protein